MSTISLKQLAQEECQEKFDSLYITSTEIGERLSVQRSTILHARRRGLLPHPIEIKGIRLFIWDRKIVEPFLKAWEISLSSRRGELR